DYCPYNGYLYYRGEDANDTNGHLFRTNGTTIEQLDNVVKDVDDIVVLNNKLYFEGEDASSGETTGNELFMFDPATIPTAIGDKNEINPISIYPNPSYGTINVKGLASARATYSIYNLTGQCVAKGIVNNKQITFTQKGLYVLQIIDGTNKTVSKITVK
ncbi:MAG: T9SS type A sorting domain-containing protein, partial [Bacteroidales bacterium]|nr:T9SS type A sorting domain-containing protein [Bacteroidales bacterium]